MAGFARDAARGSFFGVDNLGLIARWSASAERLFGYASSEALGLPITDLLPFYPDGEGGHEGWCRRADGTSFRGQAQLYPIDDTELLAVVVTDITARFAEEEVSRQIRERVDRLTATIARLVVYSIDITRGEVDVSDGLAELIGWTRGTPPRGLHELLALVPDADRQELERRMQRAIATRGSFDFEFPVFADLGERWLHVVGSYVDDARPRLVGTGMDATERRRASEALRASEAKLQAVLDATIDGILTIGEQGAIQSVNRTVTTMFRCPADQIIGTPWETYLDVPSGVLPATGMLYHISGRRADGTRFPLECGFTQVELEAEKLLLCVIRDITERRQLEQKILDVSEQLQRQIGQDLHDGLGQLLTGTAFLAKGLEANVASAYQPQAQRVVELINQAIARVRSMARGLSPIHVEAESLEAVLSDVVAESSKLLGVECVLEIRERVETDRPSTIAQLCLIVREAITNAVRHGKAHRIVVSLDKAGARSVLAITDDGRGMPEPNGSREGLGLRSMRHRAQVLGGALEVMPAEVGTVVRCWWTE